MPRIFVGTYDPLMRTAEGTIALPAPLESDNLDIPDTPTGYFALTIAAVELSDAEPVYDGRFGF